MKKLKLLLNTIALFAFLNTANAQNIEQEITSFVDETEVLINNGRRMMLHYVQARNFERVAEVYHFLNERTSDRNCVAFALEEEIHITALINNWDDFFAIVREFSNTERMSLCFPLTDHLLFNALLFEVRTNASQIFENAQAVGLTADETQLLELYFHMWEHGTDEAYRQKLRAFRREHSQSEYYDFVRNVMPRAPMRGGMGIGMGTTQFFPTGGLSNYFSSTTAFHFALDFSFNRVLIGLQADIGSMRLNTPLLSLATGYDYDLLEDDRFLFESFIFPVGYTLIRNNRFELTPFVGLGATILRSNIHTGEGSRDREFDVVNSFTVSPGLRAEFWLGRFLWTDHTGASLAHGLSLRFDAGYNMPVRFNYTPARGNVFYARAGIVWWLGNIATP